MITGGPGDYDAFGQGDPAVLGRELEMQDLLGTLSANNVENVVWITSDVHFTAATSYRPERATFTDFLPFYEFCIGPVHAGAFGPQTLDASFGPEYEYVRAPSTEGLPMNLPPPNLQSFGHMTVSESGDKLTAKLVDVTGAILYEKILFSGEVPITTTDVFVQSGEVGPDTALVMARCNMEVPSDVTVQYGVSGSGATSEVTGTATADTDYTLSTVLSDLSSDTMYEYIVTCTPQDGSAAVQSLTGSFRSLPAADAEKELSFVWVADLAGQGWGRNPELSITTVDGETITGGYVIFDVMRSMSPDFALFQGDMIYADGAIPATQEIPAEVGGGTWINNPSKDFAAISCK